MAFFIHEGFQFETAEIRKSYFGGSPTEDITVVSLEKIIEAIAPDTITSTDEPVIGGADAAARLVTMKGYWDESTVTSKPYERLIRELLNTNAALLTGGTAISGGTYHSLSHQYILPVGLSDAVDDLPSSATATTVREVINRIIIKSLEVRHDNIKKHDTANSAWEAWTAYILTKNSSNEQASARSGYFVSVS